MLLLRNRGRLCAVLTATFVVLLAAYGGDAKKTATGVELGDPKFDALPGAKADYGRLGGSLYQIELPDNWNGRLVLYMHGFQFAAPAVTVGPPDIRDYLIGNGTAWGASSYSSTDLIPGRAADETAALWDMFVSKYGHPKRTYVIGQSMGGAAAFISAERYGNRYDGALAACGYAGQSAFIETVYDFFFAGAYAAGVTQAEFNASNDIPSLITTRIEPALNDTAARKKFEDVLVGMSGGPRPFDRLGIHEAEQTNWLLAATFVPRRIVGNAERTYVLHAGSSVSSDDFSRNVVRFSADPERAKAFIEGNEITGDLRMPMITLHTTGDGVVPMDEEQILRQRVEAAGKGDHLVQRLVEDPGHCHFTQSEWEQGLADLMNWVENGVKPAGEDVFVDDLAQAGA